MVIIKQSGYYYAKVKIDGREKRYSLGVKHISSDGKELAKKIYADTGSIDEVRKTLQSQREDLAQLATRFVEEMPNKKGKPYSPASIRTYSNVAKHLTTFADEYKPMDLNDYNLEGDYEIKRRKADQFTAYFYAFDDWMKDRGMEITSREPIMSIVSVFVRHWADHYFLNLPKVPKLEKVEKPVVVLDPSFYQKFMTDDLYYRLEPSMRVVWEVAATILASTMRISDVMSMRPSDLIQGEHMMFSKVTSKTGEACELPVPDRLANIYRENLKNGSVFSGELNRSFIYDNLRPLFAMYEELHVPYSVLGVTKPMHEWVTPHMLRKTAITSYLYFGVSEMHVKHASSHSKDSKAFRRYTKVIETRFKSDFLGVHQRIGI